MNGTWSVYMHTSPSNKVYIGITSQEPLKRWGNNGSNYSKQKYFYAAIKKYGWENIKHEILFSNLAEEEAKQKEVELIAKHKSADKNYGYNLTLGGDGVKGYVPTEETKQRTKATMKKLYSNPEFRERQRLAHKRGKNHPFFGKTFSAEHKEKLSCDFSLLHEKDLKDNIYFRILFLNFVNFLTKF